MVVWDQGIDLLRAAIFAYAQALIIAVPTVITFWCYQERQLGLACTGRF